MYDVIIVGTGPSGLTALLYATLYSLRALAIGDSVGGKLVNAPDIIDYPGIEHIHGNTYIDHLLKQLEKASADLKQGEVVAISEDKHKKYAVTCANDETYTAKTIIIATGNGRKQRENKAVQLAQQLGIHHENGHIAVDCAGRTNKKKVFACGDCILYPDSLEQVTTAVATGIVAAASAYHVLTAEKPPILWGTAKIPRR